MCYYEWSLSENNIQSEYIKLLEVVLEKPILNKEKAL